MINYVSSPIYYWSTYWQTWNKILGWNTDTQKIVCQHVPQESDCGQFKEEVREHCTTLNKSCLSLKIIDRRAYYRQNGLEDFRKEIAANTKNAPRLLMDIGVPYRQFDFKS
jgi:hypothetical protein